MDILLIIIGIIVVLGIWFVLMYNRFVTLVNRAKEAWADIDVQLKRRYDLIPNLVNTVKGYATHEKETLDKVTTARTAAMGAQTLDAKNKAENELTRAIGGLMVAVEAYPDLKANQNFLELQRELSDTENKIQAARRFYNGNVRDLNTGIESFPGNVVANMFPGKFSKMEFFELDEADSAARQPVEVKF